MKKYLVTAVVAGVMLTGAHANAQALSADMLCRVAGGYNVPVGVNYQAGVDVHGRAVAPADLNAPKMHGSDIVRIPVSIDLAQALRLNVRSGVELKTTVAMVEVRPDGTVTYNGENITGDVTTLCSNMPKPKPEAPRVVKRAAKPKAAPVAPPVVEEIPAPAVEAPVVEAPVMETPVMEPQVTEPSAASVPTLPDNVTHVPDAAMPANSALQSPETDDFMPPSEDADILDLTETP